MDTTRMLLQDGFLDGHVAMRSLEEQDIFYMARAVSPGNLNEKDIRKYLVKNGEPVESGESSGVSAERYVHAAIFAARPDIKCSIHTHATALKTLSASAMVPRGHAPNMYPQPVWQAALQTQVEGRNRIMSGQIIAQIEFYFSDQNLPYDSYLLNQMQKLAIKASPLSPKKHEQKGTHNGSALTGQAWVPLELIIGFKRMQMILSPLEKNKNIRREAVARALQSSKMLELSKNRLYVRRRYPLPNSNMGTSDGSAASTASTNSGNTSEHTDDTTVTKKTQEGNDAK